MTGVLTPRTPGPTAFLSLAIPAQAASEEDPSWSRLLSEGGATGQKVLGIRNRLLGRLRPPSSSGARGATLDMLQDERDALERLVVDAVQHAQDALDCGRVAADGMYSAAEEFVETDVQRRGDPEQGGHRGEDETALRAADAFWTDGNGLSQLFLAHAPRPAQVLQAGAERSALLCFSRHMCRAVAWHA